MQVSLAAMKLSKTQMNLHLPLHPGPDQLPRLSYFTTFKRKFVPKKVKTLQTYEIWLFLSSWIPLSFLITSSIYLMPRGPTPSELSILSYRIKCASTYHLLQCSLLFVTCDVLLITSSKTLSSVSSSLVNLLMAEQAQSDAGDLDGL